MATAALQAAEHICLNEVRLHAIFLPPTTSRVPRMEERGDPPPRSPYSYRASRRLVGHQSPKISTDRVQNGPFGLLGDRGNAMADAAEPEQPVPEGPAHDAA